MESSKKPVYKYCIVPMCPNTTLSSPDKLFFLVPKHEEVRTKWCKAMKRDARKNPKLSATSSLYCCADHFNLEEDTENFIQYQIMTVQEGGRVKLRLKKGIVPHKFQCQRESKPTPERVGALKRQRLDMVKEALSEGVARENIPEPDNSIDHTDVSNNMYLIEGTRTEVNFSQKKHSFTGENVTVKREPEDFDNWKTGNEVDEDLYQKSTIQIHSHIKSEEDSINGQYWISHEEVHIKPEDDVEQSDTQVSAIEKMGHGQSNRGAAAYSAQPNKTVELNQCNNRGFKKACRPHLKNDMILPSCLDGVKMYECSRCSYKTPVEKRFKNHKGRHKPMDQIFHKCPDCPFQSKHKSSVKKHSVRHKKPDEIVWHHCTECPYKAKRKGDLKLHSLVHNNDKFFKCALCTYQTKRKGCIKTHQLKHETTDKWHACPKCPYKTIRKTHLQRHVMRHANPDQLEWYMCEECPFKTTRKFNFKQHTFTHNMDHAKWLKCTFCSYVTLHKRDFRLHQMIHQDDGPDWHKCHECPYKTIYKACLRRHVRNHKAADQINWLQCPECSYRTSQINLLKTHQMLHNAVAEWFHCFDCPYKTNWKPSLVSHVKTHRQTGRDKLT